MIRKLGKVTVVSVTHERRMDYPKLPAGASMIRAKYRCPDCKQRWRIVVNKAVSRAYKVGFQGRWKI